MKDNQKTTRKTKEEKRRLAFEKRNVKKEQNRARYGAIGGSALVIAKSTDFNRRFIAAFLALIFAISCMLVGINFATKANDAEANMTPAAETDPLSGMVLNKYLTPNSKGNYDLTMEAYTTADEVEIEEKIPTDFILVVDQSGSMDTKDMPTGDPTVQNNKYLEDIANGAYYYKDGDNYYRVYGVKDYLYRYYPANYWFTGDIVEHLGADIGWFMGETDATTNIDNAFYFREVVGNQTYYIPIRTTIEGKIGTYYMRFSYPSKLSGSTYVFNREVTTYSSNGNSPWYKNVLNGNVMTSGALWATANAAVQTLYPNDDAYTYSTINLGLTKPRTGMYINYPMYGRHLSYTKLCYRDVNGVEHEVPSNSNGRTTWEYCDDDGIARTTDSVTSARPTYNGLYTFPGTTDRITALKAALNEFAGAVANETDYFGAVDNRISIVGFSSPNYSNTELLTHTERDISSGSTNGWQKATCDNNVSEYYGKSLVSSTDGNVGTVNPKITNAITAITANGGTQPEDGLNMAYQVLANRSNTTYTIRSGNQKDQPVDRNTVVIFFTDGQPGDYHYSDQYTEANEVVAQAKQIKDYGKPLDYGTSIFSIGVFGESDANPLTYTHEIRTNSQGEDKAWKYLGGWMESYHDQYHPYSWYCLRRQWRPNSSSASDNYTATPNDTIFDYMSVVSSNYPDAEQFIAPSWLSGNYTGENGYTGATDGLRHKETAETTNKYYRMASSQDTLVAAFLQAVTMNNNALDPTTIDMNDSTVLKDFINTNDFIVGDEPTITYETENITMTNGRVTIVPNTRQSIDNLPESNGLNENKDLLQVTGYDYTEHYVSEGRQGQKLIVTLHDVYPVLDRTSDSSVLKSNTAESGIYNEDDDKALLAFRQPSISRHSYKLDILGENKKAQFNVFTRLVKTDPDASGDLSGVIVVKADGTRVNYSSNLVPPPIEEGQEAKPARIELGRMYYDDNGTEGLTDDDIDRSTFYYENVPNGYKIVTEVEPIGDDFTYYAYYDESSSQIIEFTSTTPLSKTVFTYSNHVIHISSEANSRTVTIKEAVDDSAFANQGDKFVPTVYIEAPTGVNVDETATFGETEWVKDGENRMALNKPLDPIQADGQHSITLTLPSGWKLIVDQTDDNDYSVKSATYKVDSTEATSNYAEGGWNWTITKDATITITNTRPSIPVEGINNSSNHNWIIYILVGIAAIAVIGAGIFFWKKKDEFVEE